MARRTVVVTGSASGIGAAVACRLRDEGATVIGCDLADADVVADLATAAGRAALAATAARMSGDSLDGVVAVAGIGAPDPLTVRLNFFGAQATLEGLRPLLVKGNEPRAVVVSSLASIVPHDQPIVDACLRGNEPAAVEAAADAVAAGRGRIVYGSTKRALNLWVRRRAISPEWAGAGIPLNAVAPGVVDTKGAQVLLADAALRAATELAMPQPLGFPGKADDVATAICWLVGPANAFMTGQVIFVDGGADASLRPEQF